MTYDLTGLATAVIAGVFSILAIVVPMLISAHMKDKQAAEVLGAAVRNSLGALQQASTAMVQESAPHVVLRGVPESLAPGVAYVLLHAGDEAARFGITADAIASKVAAQVGLAAIATNIAVAGSPQPLIPDPLGPLATVPAKT